MRKINKWLATLLAVLLVAGCLPLGALAEGEGEGGPPYGIEFLDECSGTVTEVTSEAEILKSVKEDAKDRNYGIESAVFNGNVLKTNYGGLFSPFQITSEEPIVKLSMNVPTSSNEIVGGLLQSLDTKGVFGTPYLLMAVTDLDTEGTICSRTYYYPVTKSEQKVTTEIPLNSGTALCALVLCIKNTGTKEWLNQSELAFPEVFIENAKDVVSYQWEFSIDPNVVNISVTGGGYLFDSNLLEAEIVFNVGDAVFDESSVEVKSEIFSLNQLEEKENGEWILHLNVSDEIKELAETDSVKFSFDIAASAADPVLVCSQFAMRGYTDEDLQNQKTPSISFTATAPLQSCKITPAVTVTRADLTIYQGGDKGYECVVGDGGTEGEPSTSLPHPLFKIAAPSGTSIDPKDLTFTTADGSKSWTVKATEDPELYYFESVGDQQDPVRVTYTDSQGKKVLNDEFDPSVVQDVYTTFDIDLYPGENAEDFSNIKAVAPAEGEGEPDEYPISVNTGKLTVRAVENKNDPTSDVVTEISSSVAAGSATAVAPASTTYTLNNTGVQLPDDSNPSLLFDDIIEDAGSTKRTKALQDKVDEKLGGDSENRNYQAKYLDLVDANNGNAWIKASGDVDIYWGYPEGTDRTTKFTLLHFTGLHRDDSNNGNSGFDVEDITKSTIETINVINDTNGIKFSVSSGGFSPFVLVWEDKPEPEPTPPPIIIPPVDDDDDEPADPDDTGVSDLLNTKDHDQYLFGYPDGTFGPGLNMTRAEAAQMFYNLLVDQDVEAPSVFDDVPEDAWYTTPVNVMAKLGIVEGVGDDMFEPDREITRAEFTAMAMRFAEGETGGKNIFSDVDEDDWFYDVVVDSIKYGWIEGYPDGTFRPANLITREEVTTIVNRMLGRLPDEDFIDAHEDDLDLFPDVTKNWAYYDVVEATNDHQYKKTSSGEDWTKLG